MYLDDILAIEQVLLSSGYNVFSHMKPQLVVRASHNEEVFNTIKTSAEDRIGMSVNERKPQLLFVTSHTDKSVVCAYIRLSDGSKVKNQSTLR